MNNRILTNAQSSLQRDESLLEATIGDEEIEVNRSLYEAQKRIISTVLDFTTLRSFSPVEAINDMIETWLFNGSDTHISNTKIDRQRLQILFRLVELLYNIQIDLENLYYVEKILELAEKSDNPPIVSE